MKNYFLATAVAALSVSAAMLLLPFMLTTDYVW